MNGMKKQRSQSCGVIKDDEGRGHLTPVMLSSSCVILGSNAAISQGIWEEKAQGHLGFALFATNLLPDEKSKEPSKPRTGMSLLCRSDGPSNAQGLSGQPQIYCGASPSESSRGRNCCPLMPDFESILFAVYLSSLPWLLQLAKVKW